MGAIVLHRNPAENFVSMVFFMVSFLLRRSKFRNMGKDPVEVTSSQLSQVLGWRVAS